MFGGYINRAFGVESGFNPLAKNPRSSATGLGQFTEGTWRGLMQLQPELGLTLDGRTDPVQARRAMEAFTAANAGILKKRGFDVNDNNLYAMHRFGQAGGPRLLSSDPNARIETVFGPDVMQANPDLAGKTVGQVLARFGGNGNALSPDAPASATEFSAQARRAPGNFGSPQTLFEAARNSADAPGAESAGYDLSGSLQGAGAALASIGSPEQGAALSKLVRPREVDQFQIIANPATGALLRVNRRTGKTESITGAVPTKSDFDKKIDEERAKAFIDQRGKAQEAVASLTSAAEARDILDKGVITGFGADWRLQIGKALRQAGVNYSQDDIANTEAFIANRAQEVGRTIKQFGAGTGLSDADREYAQKAAAGQIALDEQGLRRILDIGERASRNVVKNFNDEATRFGKADLMIEAPAERKRAAPAAAPGVGKRPPLDSIFK